MCDLREIRLLFLAGGGGRAPLTKYVFLGVLVTLSSLPLSRSHTIYIYIVCVSVYILFYTRQNARNSCGERASRLDRPPNTQPLFSFLLLSSIYVDLQNLEQRNKRILKEEKKKMGRRSKLATASSLPLLAGRITASVYLLATNLLAAQSRRCNIVRSGRMRSALEAYVISSLVFCILASTKAKQQKRKTRRKKKKENYKRVWSLKPRSASSFISTS